MKTLFDLSIVSLILVGLSFSPSVGAETPTHLYAYSDSHFLINLPQLNGRIAL